MAMAKYLRSKLGTDSNEPKESSNIKNSLFWDLIAKVLTLIIPNANPDYEKTLHLVDEWLIEFGEDGIPDREIGLNSQGIPILAGPDERNYGYWHDTNMRINDFENNEISSDYFQEKWNVFFNYGDSK